MNILVTGGAGYIGSHTVVELLNAGHKPVIVDNFCNSNPGVIDAIKKITQQEVPLFTVDLKNYEATLAALSTYNFDAIIHFAGLKSVNESIEDSVEYYHNNLGSLITICRLADERAINTVIFSSSATIYGDVTTQPTLESMPSDQAINPYGRTKSFGEIILKDWCISNASASVTSLRYFNPIGAHESGLIGENPNGTPNNLLPYVAQVANGKLKKLRVFGNDYDTPDGTGIRDYIHVVDLAKGHVAALENRHQKAGFDAFNLGTGTGSSVLEVIAAYEEASGKRVPYEIVGRRDGDVARSYADASKAQSTFNWKAERNLQTACLDMQRFQDNLV